MKKEPKTLKDIYDVSKQSYVSDEAEEVVEDLRNMIKEWIEHIESTEKKFVKHFKADEKKWNDEYEQGQHRDYEYNLASEWLGSVPVRFANEHAQVKILKKIFNLEDAK